MKRTILTVLAITGCLAACEPRSGHNTSQEEAGGIVGGFDAKAADVTPQGAASAVVAIEVTLEDGLSLCTGTLIQPRIVLTAAHCLLDVQKVGELTVALHALDLTTAPPPTALFYSVTNYVIHPDFELKSGGYDQHNDLALLLLDRAAPATTKLAELPAPGFSMDAVQKLVTFGYGISDDRLNADDEGARILRTTSYSKGSFGIFPMAGAPKALPAVDKYLGMIGSLAQTTSVCHGDSGGPLLGMRDGAGPVLIGVNDMVLPAYTGERGRAHDEAVKNGTLGEFAQKYPDTRVCMGGWNVFVNLLPQLKWIDEASKKLLK